MAVLLQCFDQMYVCLCEISPVFENNKRVWSLSPIWHGVMNYAFAVVYAVSGLIFLRMSFMPQVHPVMNLVLSSTAGLAFFFSQYYFRKK